MATIEPQITSRPQRGAAPTGAAGTTAASPADAARAKSLRQAIAIGVLSLCLIVGGGIVWWFFYGSTPTRQEVKVDPTQQVPMDVRGARSRARPARTITRLGNNGWLARGLVAEARITQQDGAYVFSNFRIPAAGPLEGDDLQLWLARWRIVQDPAMAQEWGVSEQQIEKLRKIQQPPQMRSAFDPTPAQRESLRQAFETWRKASDGPSRAVAQKQFLDLLDEQAKANVDASRQALNSRLVEIRAVLTPKQIAKILGK